ncbi:MAG: VanW family protein [Sandaracinaceae bacterium]
MAVDGSAPEQSRDVSASGLTLDGARPEPPGRLGPVAVLERLRVIVAVASFAAAGGALALGLAGPSQASSATRARAPDAVVRIDGGGPDATMLVPKGSDPDAIARAFADRWSHETLTIEIADHAPITQSRAGWGARIDRARLASMLAQALESTSRMRRLGGAELTLPPPVALDEAAAFEQLAQIKDGYDRRASDARIDVRTQQIRAHVDGRILDVHGTLDALRSGLEAGRSQVSAAVQQRPARRSEAELLGLDLSAVLGSYETHYSSIDESRDRAFNLQVAAQKIDGIVLMPHETFDFNELVGERSEANGFRPAPVIAGGELVDGLGGGTCQVAGTLHAAVFFAGLPVVERSPHSRPSTYIYMGLDAVVSYPQLNLRFQNDLDVPVAVGFTVEGGIARAEIRGPSLPRLVTFVRRIDDVLAYTEREIADSSLPRGTRVLQQRGVPGFEITSFRIVRDTAMNQARRTRAEDHYPPTEQIWRVGSGGVAAPDYEPPAGDGHGEYTADGYLEVTQGEGVRGQRVVRRAGRTGVAGWTERLGFPQP